jgi:two-component system, NarL family, sensor histidine kinase UhpB
MAAMGEALPIHKRSSSARSAALIRKLLRIPLFYKILVANSAIVALGAIAGTIITVWHVEAYPHAQHYELIALFAAAGLAISFAVNYLALKLALAPLDQIQSTVDEVRGGRRDVRLDAGALSDDRFDRLAATFNRMLDTLEQDAHQLHQLSQATLQAQEEERQRVARELHDEAAQALTSLLVRLRLLERAGDHAAARQHIQELRALMAGALENVRRIALELRPTILDDLGLAAALGWRVDEFNAAGAARATLQVVDIDGRLPRPIELTCYRVVQEALTNIARHADATHVRIALRREPGQLALEIRDDGRGFDATAIQADRARGLGLRGMRERLALVGGELTLDSQPGRGTYVRARVPLPDTRTDKRASE